MKVTHMKLHLGFSLDLSWYWIWIVIKLKVLNEVIWVNLKPASFIIIRLKISYEFINEWLIYEYITVTRSWKQHGPDDQFSLLGPDDQFSLKKNIQCEKRWH